MALMHCCCFCCSPKSGSITIGVLQLLSLVVGAGLVGLVLTGIRFIQQESSLTDILQDFFEVDLDAVEISSQLDELQAVLEKRTRIVERVLYGMLGYIALDFIATCLMIHGARTNGSKLLVPWILLNGLRACASLAAGIYMMMKKNDWAEDLSIELNDIINTATALRPKEEHIQHVDPAILETSLTSAAGVLIGGSILSIYFVLVVCSQFQIIHHNRAQTKLVQRRVSIAPSGTLSPSTSFHRNVNGAGDPPGTQIPMVTMANAGYYGAEAYDNPAYAPNAPPANQHMAAPPKQPVFHMSNGYNNDFSASQPAAYYPNQHQQYNSGQEQRRRSQLHPDIITSNGNRNQVVTGGGYAGNWQSGKGQFYSEPAPDYD